MYMILWRRVACERQTKRETQTVKCVDICRNSCNIKNQFPLKWYKIDSNLFSGFFFSKGRNSRQVYSSHMCILLSFWDLKAGFLKQIFITTIQLLNMINKGPTWVIAVVKVSYCSVRSMFIINFSLCASKIYCEI